MTSDSVSNSLDIKLPNWVSKQLNSSASKASSVVSKEQRSMATQVVLKKGLPSRKDEDWKYTDLSKFLESDYNSVNSAVSQDLKNLLNEALPTSFSAYRIVFVNGRYQSSLSDQDLPKGMSICTFQAEQNEKSVQYMKDLLSRTDIQERTCLSALNIACSDDGIGIVVDSNAKITQPVAIISIITRDANNTAIFPRVLLEAKTGSQVNVLDISISEEESSYFCTAVTEIFVAENASVEQDIINSHSKRAFNYRNLIVRQSANSRYNGNFFNFGSALTRNDIDVKLLGSGIDSHVNGLAVLSGDQQVDNNSIMEHALPHCESKQIFKGIYNDKSQGVFDGTIIVRPDAQKTNAIQSSQSLLLTDTASSYSKPQLKIWADDVKCTHGATVGQIDEKALFYLRSRGIPEQSARAMLILAFAGEVLAEVKCETVRELLQSKVQDLLG